MNPSLTRVLDTVGTIILGKEQQIRLAVTCLLARGHLLIEDLPGVGKTTLAHVQARALGLDGSGNVYVAGWTSSSDFPLESPFQEEMVVGLYDFQNVDSFISKLSGDSSSLLFSSYLGGSHADQTYAMVVDGDGDVVDALFTLLRRDDHFLQRLCVYNRCTKCQSSG